MELDIRDINMLRGIHDSLNGASTLLSALARYYGVDLNVQSAIDIIVDILETDRSELQELLSKDVKSQSTGHAMDDELVAKQ